MKNLFLALCLLVSPLCLRAADFTLRPDQASALISVWPALDGYEKSVDQGPGNPQKIIRVNFTFASEVRKKLAADHRAILDAWKAYVDRAQKLQAEVAESIGGPAATYDEKNAKHTAELNKRAGHDFDTLTISLSPISMDDLLGTDNPIPDSVLTAFAVLREPTALPAKK